MWKKVIAEPKELIVEEEGKSKPLCILEQ